MNGVRTTINTRFRAVLACLFCCVLPINTAYSKGSQHRYPNELQGFRLYAEYLAPLRPGTSDQDAVRRVLGDTAAVKRDGWTIFTIYTMKSGPVYNPVLGPLHEISVKPDGVIPMASVKFPPMFAHCHRFVSEINISFDVYSDTSGLEYWLHQQDTKFGSKGDLFRVVYGQKRPPYPPNTRC